MDGMALDMQHAYEQHVPTERGHRNEREAFAAAVQSDFAHEPQHTLEALRAREQAQPAGARAEEEQSESEDDGAGEEEEQDDDSEEESDSEEDEGQSTEPNCGCCRRGRGLCTQRGVPGHLPMQQIRVRR